MEFCTYFDSNYSDKGWVCERTLRERSPGSRLHILALDAEVERQVLERANAGRNVALVTLDEVEVFDPRLLAAKENRLRKEYYATLTPFLPQYLFRTHPGMETLYYTDADMAFWSDPEEIERVFGDHHIMVTDHGFEPPRSGVRFNVGILGYRNSPECAEFLEWWQDRCLEWCKWETTPDGRCADQGWLGILHDEPDRFKGALSCPQPGINLGPWGVARHRVERQDGRLVLDGQHNLVCYHYHEFRMTGADTYHPTGWKHTADHRRLIYEPYFQLMREQIRYRRSAGGGGT